MEPEQRSSSASGLVAPETETGYYREIPTFSNQHELFRFLLRFPEISSFPFSLFPNFVQPLNYNLTVALNQILSKLIVIQSSLCFTLQLTFQLTFCIQSLGVFLTINERLIEIQCHLLLLCA